MNFPVILSCFLNLLTVAATAGLLYNLANNQKAQDTLREEVMRILPTPETPLTTESLTSLPYMRACLKESMRITPVFSGNFRGAGRDMVIQGYQIPFEVILPHCRLTISIFLCACYRQICFWAPEQSLMTPNLLNDLMNISQDDS